MMNGAPEEGLWMAPSFNTLGLADVVSDEGFQNTDPLRTQSLIHSSSCQQLTEDLV